MEAFHGPHWYVSEGHPGPTSFELPAEWSAYRDHYRSQKPWYTNLRVISRKGSVYLLEPEGNEEALVPLGDGLFRVGEDGRSPEHLRFDTVLNGQALRANLSGCDCYRTFTP